MEQKIWTIEKKCRLDEFLRKELPSLFPGKDVSNSKIRRLIVAGSIYVNGRQCRIPAYDLFPKSKVCAEIDEEKLFFEKQPQDIDFVLTEQNVLYEDDSIIIVDKPAFIPTEGTIVESRKSMHSCVVDYLWKKNPALRNPPYVGIMHRLDRETSGVLLFTKTRQVNKAVSDMFQNHTAMKTYRAVATGNPNNCKKQFVIENYIGRITAKSARCKIGPLSESRGGQYAKTEFETVGSNNSKLFFNCRLFTGRTHQIRVHLSGAGYPLLGDTLYGGKEDHRIMLHAMSLEFPHPVTGQIMTVEAPLPDGFDF
ncbi:MAG: RluA family pseudouridine synthase [Treponema sp.]|nr:RluA family pseudouridine synthase [Candidatus Treponema equi]